MVQKEKKIQQKKETKSLNKQIAVVMLGSRQFIVSEGSLIKVEKLNQEPKKTFQTDDLLSDKKVSYQILENVKDKKISHIKFRNKTRYLKRLGHRQLLSMIEIESIL